MKRRLPTPAPKCLVFALLVLTICSWIPASRAADALKRPVNLLFIITDQQRWDTLACGGNTIIKTPNLDRIAHEGVRFTNAYSSCPVCSPARTTILTGLSTATHKVFTNEVIRDEKLPDCVTFDEILIRHGYRGEYYGKYHSPYKMALAYANAVPWVNGNTPPPGCRAKLSEAAEFTKYMDENVPLRPLKPGEQIANLYGRPYRPDPLDGASRVTPEQIAKLAKNKVALAEREIGQGTTFGCLEIPPEFTLAAHTAKEALAALDHLKDGPFTLTVSISPPHPPMVLPKPYYGMYPADQMPVPESIKDPRSNSPYPERKVGPTDTYRDEANVRQMKSDYYGLITEDDDWIGRILKKLDDLGLADHTLIVFTADHGEMLGDHGMSSKFVFYEGSVHIPLLMRLPGVIPAGKVVTAPVAQIDLFSTILDYCGMGTPPSEGADLRPLIEGKDSGAGRVAISEWHSPRVPRFMVFDGRWKLLYADADDKKSLDALYDLQTDPIEMNNLIGHNPDREKSRTEVERMKKLLLAWLDRVKSPDLEPVKARATLAE